jgi:hypothetical protein
VPCVASCRCVLASVTPHKKRSVAIRVGSLLILLIFLGEPGGNQTHDPKIKSPATIHTFRPNAPSFIS